MKRTISAVCVAFFLGMSARVLMVEERFLELGSLPLPVALGEETPGVQGKPGPEPKAAPPAEAESQGAPAGAKTPSGLPPGVVARVNGRDITVEEYTSYLLASIGRSRLDEYVNRLLVEEKARASGISLEPSEVEAAVQETIDRTIRSQYRGEKETYLESLRRRHRTLEEEIARLRQELYYDMLLDRLIVQSRKISEADVVRRFEELHGEKGVQYVLRHILVSTRPMSDSSRGESAEGTITRRTPMEAKERAEKARQEILAGLPFAEAVRKYSDDAYTRRQEGRIPRYRARMFGDKFHAAVEALTPEKPLSEVVESPRGYHVIELVEKRVTKLEDVRSEIEAWLKTAPPTPRERQELLRGLREAAKIEGLE